MSVLLRLRDLYCAYYTIRGLGSSLAFVDNSVLQKMQIMAFDYSQSATQYTENNEVLIVQFVAFELRIRGLVELIFCSLGFVSSG